MDTADVAGGVGDPGTFTFSPAAPGVVAYTYSLNGGDPHTGQRRA